MPTTPAQRRKYGFEGAPLTATRVLVKEMPGTFGGHVAHALLAIDDVNGTITSCNVYGGKEDQHLGEKYNRAEMTRPLPAKGDSKWKKYASKGYTDGNVSHWSVLEDVNEKVEAEEAPQI